MPYQKTSELKSPKGEKRVKKQGSDKKIMKQNLHLINPNLIPTNTITEHLLNRSVRGRPIKQFLKLVKGDPDGSIEREN